MSFDFQPALVVAAVAVLALTHLFAHRIRALHYIPRSRWLSAAGGASVAYVFLHLLPELSAAQRENLIELGFLETELIWLLAMAGLTLFYVLEVRFRRIADKGADAAEHHREYRLHLISFSLYNLITGYLLTQREDSDIARLVFFALAMGLHFLVTDTGLRQNFASGWLAHGRWIVAGAVVSGYALGSVLQLPEAIISGLVAFLGGGIILNVLKEELPDDRKSQLIPFILGAAIYAGLLLLAG